MSDKLGVFAFRITPFNRNGSRFVETILYGQFERVPLSHQTKNIQEKPINLIIR